MKSLRFRKISRLPYHKDTNKRAFFYFNTKAIIIFRHKLIRIKGPNILF